MAKTISELEAEKARIIDEAQELLDVPVGTMTAEDSAKVESLLAKADGIARQIESTKAVENFQARPLNPEVTRLVNRGSGLPQQPRDSSQYGAFHRSTSGGPVFQDSDGRKIQAFSAAMPIAERPSDGELGACIHSMLTGRILNAQIGSTDSAGGYLLTPQMSGMILDLARSASVCMRAGAMTLPMSTSEMAIAKVDSDATAEWRSEAVAVTASTMTFGRINLRAKTLAALVPVSVELLEDASNAPAVIEQALASVLGQTLDDAALSGTGAGAEPIGIRHTTGINTQTSVGTPTAGAATYAKVTGAIKSILDANFPGTSAELAWIQNPRDAVNWGALADTTYQPLLAPPIVAAMQQFTTTAMPRNEGGGGAESSAIIGHFPSLLFGMRTSGVQMQILDSGSAVDSASTTWNATSQLLKFIRVYLRADVAVLRPTWFTLLSGITSA